MRGSGDSGRSFSLPYAELFLNFAGDFYCIHARKRKFQPLITNFYVTKRCNFMCRYCYPPGDEPELPVPEAEAILAKIRPSAPALNLTGGEPLLYDGIGALIRRARQLGFRPLILSTNGLLIDRVDEELAGLDHLIISLDSLDEQVNDSLSGVKGITRRVVRNIVKSAALSRRRGFALSIHSVAAPETLAGFEQIVDFCQELGITFSFSPEHGRYEPHGGLRQSAEYTRLIDRLIALKRRGKPVASSFGYMRKIRNFDPHGCYPFVSPRVEPDGRVYLPCQRIRQRHVYLQDYGNLCDLMRREAQWDTGPQCRDRCFLACYLEVERYLRRPLSLLREVSIRSWLLGRETPARPPAQAGAEDVRS